MTPPIEDQWVLDELPFHFDPLDANLDKRFPNVRAPVHWGMVVGALDNSWSESVAVPGVDWHLDLFVPGDLKLPTHMTPTRRMSWRRVARHCAFVIVRVNQETPNQARDAGRPAVRALLAVLRNSYPSMILSDTIWEGIVTVRKNKIGVGVGDVRMGLREAKPASLLSKVGYELMATRILALPHHITRALEWMQLARASPVLVDSFAHFWFALIALVRFGQPEGGNDLTRVLAYLKQLRTGASGHPVLGKGRAEALEELFRRANKARNWLFHRDDDTLITDGLINELEDGLFQLIQPEVSQLRAK